MDHGKLAMGRRFSISATVVVVTSGGALALRVAPMVVV
jgi:hypothetical protein